MAFPISPSNNQIALVNGIEYVYNTSKGAWYRYGDATANVITSNTFQVLSSITFADGTSQTSAASPTDSYARDTANTASNNITILQGVNTTQNTNITAADAKAQAAFDSANVIVGVNTTQNTNITAVNTFAQSAYDKANTVVLVSITDETTSSGTYYPLLSTATTGTLATSNTSSSKLSYVPSTGTLTTVDLNTTSDIKFKDNVQPIDSAINIINTIDGVSFNWKETGKKSYGVIAQQLKEVLPELVSQEDRGLSVSYLPLIAILIEAVKEQQKQIDELKK